MSIFRLKAEATNTILPPQHGSCNTDSVAGGSSRRLSLLSAVLCAQGVDDPVGGLLRIVVRQRALGIPERESKGETHTPRRNALALVPIELHNRNQRRGCRR